MQFPQLSANDPPADVILLLEGTYPMVRGGVAGWLDQLIRGLPELSFAVIFLGSRPQDYQGLRYELADNVVHLECHYLVDGSVQRKANRRPPRGCPAAFAASRRFHEHLKKDSATPDQALSEVTQLLGKRGGLSREDFLHSEAAWHEIVRHYEEDYTEPSFLHYFWSVRNMHAPLFVLAEIANNLPPGRCLHAISTGYGGFLGALAHHRTGLPLLVTEHGIYTKERHIDLLEAEWIHTPQDRLSHGLSYDTGYLRHLWIRFFQSLGRMTYSAAARITTLYCGNQQRQIADGADPARTEVIPNGIKIERFRPLREQTQANDRPIVVLLGRVTPIKDIKTFIRSMHHLLARVPEAEGWIVGPDDEDPAYAQECRDLTEQLMLGERLKFLGFQSTEKILAQAKLVVLTSISEAQPLVVLEALAAGVPVITSDVGSCREMLLGDGSPAQAAGRIVPIASPERTASAAAELLNSRDAWQAAREVGIERVEQEYAEALMLERYRTLYQGAAGEDVEHHSKETALWPE
ncbi:DUF3492 domain-containing protein [Pistricoccus aurantiacus]|uniref:DUF3492 domain-containing protein n=1 Tax=Pistricoccus aurantiacus TaxID=1883414 RepID=A0A5B8SUU1_9GAMM|nr:GT4 family glycosyltransferase PelF [Pistricoccus aurantiacus]QEA39295.1 DUF3492 domain-containing protein [Pistricoccus aurantiacus]